MDLKVQQVGDFQVPRAHHHCSAAELDPCEPFSSWIPPGAVPSIGIYEDVRSCLHHPAQPEKQRGVICACQVKPGVARTGHARPQQPGMVFPIGSQQCTREHDAHGPPAGKQLQGKGTVGTEMEADVHGGAGAGEFFQVGLGGYLSQSMPEVQPGLP